MMMRDPQDFGARQRIRELLQKLASDPSREIYRIVEGIGRVIDVALQSCAGCRVKSRWVLTHSLLGCGIGQSTELTALHQNHEGAVSATTY